MNMHNQYAIRTIICKGCGKYITKRMPKRKKYCSHVCYKTSPRQHRRTGKIMSCGQCGKDIYITKSRIVKNKKYFCSIEHQIKWQRRDKIDYTCKICGTNFRWSPSRPKNNNPKYCSLDCRDKDPERIIMLREMNRKQQHTKINKLEKFAYSILDKIDIEYKPQWMIANKFCVDAFVPSYNLIIQFDGDYWHGKPEKYQELDHRQQKRILIDRSQEKYFDKCGYTWVRFWESDIRKRPEWFKSQLQHLIQSLSE